MKKLLYITVNSKPENLSASKTVGRIFVNKFLEKNENFEVDELDLYEIHIPRLKYEYFESRNCIIKNKEADKLSKEEKIEYAKIVSLVNQFKEADMYVIAAPMWSLSFPAPLKEYLDCIVMQDETIKVTEDKVKGLLKDKKRSCVYIQSSGGKIPWIVSKVLNRGLNYIEDIMTMMGIREFEELLVDGTGYTEEEKNKAIEKAIEEIDDIIKHIKFRK